MGDLLFWRYVGAATLQLVCVIAGSLATFWLGATLGHLFGALVHRYKGHRAAQLRLAQLEEGLARTVQLYKDREKDMEEMLGQAMQRRDENERLRHLLAASTAPCIYCGLAAADWGKCSNGFPGCGRADDWGTAVGTIPLVVTPAFVDAVEGEVGTGAGAWDMVGGAELCQAVLRVARIRETRAARALADVLAAYRRGDSAEVLGVLRDLAELEGLLEFIPERGKGNAKEEHTVGHAAPAATCSNGCGGCGCTGHAGGAAELHDVGSSEKGSGFDGN